MSACWQALLKLPGSWLNPCCPHAIVNLFRVVCPSVTRILTRMDIKLISHVLLSACRVAFHVARGEEFEMALFTLRERGGLAHVLENYQTPDGHVCILSHLGKTRSRVQAVLVLIADFISTKLRR
jgi:hypothetical protein